MEERVSLCACFDYVWTGLAGCMGCEFLGDFYEGKRLVYKKAIAYNALFQSCLAKRPYNLFHRKNLEMRTRDVVRGFGNKATWDRPFSEHFRTFVNEIINQYFHLQRNVRLYVMMSLVLEQVTLIWCI